MTNRINFIARIRLTDFNIQSGISTGSIYCPAYNVNQVIILTYDQYIQLVHLCKNQNYGRIINENNHFIIDRCFVSSIINNTF